MPKRSVGGRARCAAEAGTTRGSSPGGPRRCRGARQEGPARGRSAMLSDAPGTCAARAAGALERALLFYCCLFGNMLGAEKKGKEKLGGSCPRSQGKGQTDCHTAPGAGHFPPLRAPTILSLQDADGLHWPPAPKGQPARDREPGVPGLGPPRGAVRAQASKFPSGTSCSSLGLSQSASAAARQGWGARGRKQQAPGQLSSQKEPEPPSDTLQALQGGRGHGGHTCVFVNTYECVFMRM